MRWRGVRRSRNVIDVRGRGRGAAKAGGGVSLGVLAIVVVGWFLGVDLTPLLGGGGMAPTTATRSAPLSAADEERGAFAASVLTLTEDVWGEVYPNQTGRPYDEPELVLFSGTVASACGGGSAATGPFYCPADERAYLDTDFFVQMDRRLGAGGDFAAAYVIAHEVGHHIQNELGILGQVRAEQRRAGQAASNALQVRVELQADCFAGIWGRYVGDRLEPGDLDEALNAARAIGDDTLARASGRAVRPHTFTHGTSAQRQRWFATGYETGDMNACDTFAARTL